MEAETSFAADLSAALSDTSAQSVEPTSAAPVDPTAQPGADTTDPAVASASPSTETVPSKQGPIPFDVHSKALENARTKARAEYEAEVEQQYGWAKTVDRAAVAQAVQIAQRFQQDPAGYIRDLLAEAISNPELAPMVRSTMARALGQRPAATPAPVDLTPIPVQMEDGRTVSLFTADQFNAALDARVAELRKEFRPAVETAAQLKAAREETERMQQAETFGATALKELQTLPQFKEHAKDIAAAVAKMPLPSDHPAEVTAAAFRAYASLVLPKLSTLERRAALTDQHAAAAATTVNPSRVSAATPKSWDEMSTAEALAHAASGMAG